LAGLASLTRFSVAGFSLRRNMVEGILWCATFLGTPFLAALPMGTEFENRTLGLLLSQPLSRAEIWRLKVLATAVAALPPAILFGLAARPIWSMDSLPMLAGAVAIVATTAGAMFWTLLARSTLGGLVLNYCFVVMWIFFATLPGVVGRDGQVSRFYVSVTIAVVTIYAGVMIWLGRRMLLRFQAVEGMQADEAFTPGARFVPRALSGWLRCRPTGALRNLVLREFRLLRVVWFLTLFSLAAWIFVVAFRLMPSDTGRTDVSDAAVVLSVLFSVLVAALAGLLSLGEEKTWGTHAWQLTQPISVSLQWMVKLGVAVFTAVICAAAVPLGVLLLGGWLRGSPWLYLRNGEMWNWPLQMAVLAVAAFWCSSVLKGSVRAAVLLFPLILVLAVSGAAGAWLARFLDSHGLMIATVARLDPISVGSGLSRISGYGMAYLLVIGLIALLGVALIQSRWFFRSQAEDTKLRAALCLMPLAGTSLLCVLGLGLFGSFTSEVWHQQRTILRETHAAIETVRQGMNEKTTSRLRLTTSDLAKAASLSDRTLSWLDNANITVEPVPPSATGSKVPARSHALFGQLVLATPGRPAMSYSAVISNRRHNCSLIFNPGGFNPGRAMGMLDGSCD
jgi:ABC-type transport system involved in multi-copper enzyme maturation permease subunit